MNLYGEQPQEKAMQTLIHETNRLGSNLLFHTKALSKWFSDHGKTVNQIEGKMDSQPYISIEYLKSTKIELERVIDQYYEQFKNDFVEPHKD